MTEANRGNPREGLMASRAVHWEEGMFLTPQHFQAADRYQRRSLREAEDWFHPFNWGFRLIVFEPAMANYELTLSECEARFRDGTHLSIGEGRDISPLKIHLRSALENSGETTVFLAVPSFQLGVKIAEEKPSTHGPRFWIDTAEFDDENTGAESDKISLRFRRPQARLLHSGESTGGYEILPLARVKYSGLDGAVPEVDLSSVPPLLSLNAWTWLRDEVQKLSNQIGGRIDQLAEQAVDRELSFRGQDPGDAERLLKLAALNESGPPLRVMSFTPGFTPLAVYVELCRIVGRLSLFLRERRAPNLPAYDHEKLGPCFVEVIEIIRASLKGVEPTRVRSVVFARIGNQLQVPVEDEWLRADHSLFLGVETELSEEECDLILRADELDRTIGSGSQVETLFARRSPGLSLTTGRVPHDLPSRKGLVYFAIGRDNSRVWAGVLIDRTVAVRFNLDQAAFQGNETVRVTMPDGRSTNLRFVLYVVPPR
jgi:type VI secretion system protein ImpJ